MFKGKDKNPSFSASSDFFHQTTKVRKMSLFIICTGVVDIRRTSFKTVYFFTLKLN